MAIINVYHGSLEVVTQPEIREPNRRLDYGTGFYTTTAYWQAERWVQRRMRESKIAKGYVNVYDFNDTALIQLKSLIFDGMKEKFRSFSGRLTRRIIFVMLLTMTVVSGLVILFAAGGTIKLVNNHYEDVLKLTEAPGGGFAVSLIAQ